MQPQPFGKYLLGDIMAKTTLGDMVKAIPREGPPQLVLIHRLCAEILETPEAKALVLRQAKQWTAIRELHTLNLLEAGESSGHLYYACEHEQGKLLSEVLERCRQEGIPLSPDQAVYLAGRIVGALESLAGQKAVLGCLSPERVLVTFEGEVKLLPGVIKDLQTTPVLASPVLDHYRRYLPPTQSTGNLSKASTDRYSAGALLFEFLAHAPLCPPGGQADPAARLEEAARGAGGAEPLQGNLLSILKKSLLMDSSEAYPDLAAMRADLDQLITSGEYSPTTFNIAFLMHTLFRGEDEAIAEADKQFLAVDRSAFSPPAPPPKPAEPPAPPAPPPAARAAAPPEETSSFGLEEEPSRKGLWIGLGALAVVAVLATLAWFAFLRPRGPSKAELQAQEELKRLQAQQVEMAQKMRSLEEERNQLASQVTNAKTEEERKKAQRALDETQRRLQAQQEEQKRLTTSTPAPPPEKKPAAVPATQQAPASSQGAPAGAPGAAAGTASSSSNPAEKSEQQAQPAAQPAAEPPPKAQAPAPAATKAGDFVELWAVDVKPKQLGDLRIDATPMARQNHLSGTIWVEVQIDETGAVTSATVVKGPRLDYGMNATCVEAAKRLRYSPAMKDGVPVKTKLTFPVVIKGS